jgi:hypothetical protein
MDHNPNSQDTNLYDLKEARRRLKAQKKVVKQSAKKSDPNQLKWYHYVQFVFFLLVVAYLMQQC